MSQSREFFSFHWRDALLTSIIEIALLLISYIMAVCAHNLWHAGLFVDTVVFYLTLTAATLVFLQIIRYKFPPRDGVFTQKENLQVLYIYRLMNFLCMTNLFIFYQGSLLPTPLRKFFLRKLGSKIGKGLISIAGLILDPYAVEIEPMALIGQDAMLLPALISSDKLVRKKIKVCSKAVVGGRSIVMPGVTVGEGAMIKAMSVVAPDTQIGPYEIWAGNPAQKTGEIPLDKRNVPSAFSSWMDMVISPLAELSLLLISGFGAWGVVTYYHFGVFGAVISFSVILWISTLLTLLIVRFSFPLKDGKYDFIKEPLPCFIWNFHGFLCIMNLCLPYQNGLVAPPLRRLLSFLLGAKFNLSPKAIPDHGFVFDPYMVEISPGALIGYNTLIVGHIMSTDALILSKINFEEGAVVGARSMVLPGVNIGRGARVEALSLVTVGKKVGDNEIWMGIPARKVGEGVKSSANFCADNLDLLNIILSEIMILGTIVYGLFQLHPFWRGDGFALLILFYAFNFVITMFVMAVLRWFFLLKPGTYQPQGHPGVVRCWRLYGFLTMMNLKIAHFNLLLPPHLRKVFLRLLGMKTPFCDFCPIEGTVLDPHLVSIGKNVCIGLEAVISPVEIRDGTLLLGPVHLGDGVLIGQRAVISSGVTIGDGAVIEPMSLVLPGTIIPAHEIWAGIPAKKVGEVSKV